MWSTTHYVYGVGFYSLVATSDGGYAIAGTCGDSLLVKIDALGTVEWNRTYRWDTANEARSLIVTSDGGYAFAGFFGSQYYNDYHGAFLIKTDAFGNMEWNQTYGEIYFNCAYSLVETSDGGYALAGTLRYFHVLRSNEGGFVVKTDEYGVAPEAAWVVLPFLLAGTLAVFISKKKLFPKRS